jgi:predicted PurR-regulated permease PerM
MSAPSRTGTGFAGRADWLTRRRILGLALLAATVIALYLCFLLAQPFLPALAWALALAIVARPLHAWIASHVRNPDLAAGIAVALVALTLLAPALLMLHHLLQEVAVGVDRLQTEANSGQWRDSLSELPWLANSVEWVEKHVDVRKEVGRVVTTVAGDVSSLVTGSIWAIAQLLITLFALFYFFRDRHGALEMLRSLVPLSEVETSKVFRRVADTVHATIYGTLFCAAVQGALGGLIFWWLGLPTPVLWGVIMGLLAVVPYFGAFVIWVPAAIYLALTGYWIRAIILTLWGGVIIALIDNLLYPILVGRRLRLHTLPVFFAIIGGLALFGASGVILGPVILAVTSALLDIWHGRIAHSRRTGCEELSQP